MLVLLGAGNNYDYEPVRRIVLDRLGKAADVQIVVAEWLIAEQPMALPAHVRRLAEYPISRYLAAFDFAISAVGYNSFHELLFAGVPTIFVPNENPQQDDQLGARDVRRVPRPRPAACAARRSIVSGRRSTRCSTATCAPRSARAARRSASTNGALEAARMIEEMAYARRADRP